MDKAIEMGRSGILLISNSTVYGRGYLDHVAEEILSFLGNRRRILFVPFALYNWDAYTATFRDRLRPMGFDVRPIHRLLDLVGELNSAEAVFVGGGNTFRLLKTLYDYDLVQKISRKVAAGMPYIGSSAGSIVACPSLMTTKDMPIVQPPSFSALNIVPFQISPHYLDPDPRSTHMGETQEERIRQYLEENDRPVVGLREGAFLRITGDSVILQGTAGARIFRKGLDPVESVAGDELSHLILTN